MHCKGAILLSNKNHELSFGINQFCKKHKINFHTSLDYADFIFKLITLKPEIIFFDADTIKFDYNIFKLFAQNEHYGVFKLALIATDTSKFSEINDDKIFICTTSDYQEQFLEVINKIEHYNKKIITDEELRMYRIKLNILLRDLGITSKHMGYNFIKDIVIEIIKDQKSVVSLTQHLYPTIAMRYNTMVKNIERNIRNALSHTLKNCRNEAMMNQIKTLGDAVPSNKQFITYLVDKVVDE